MSVADATGSGDTAPPLSSSNGATAGPATPAHNKEMATRFLVGLDPHATKFTFQFFGDGAARYAEIVHGTLDEVWPKVLALNTPQRGIGVFVTISETDFKGRKAENVVRPRALFADADGGEQVKRCVSMLEAHGCSPSLVVNSGRGYHFYFCSDVPLDQFSLLQKQLIAKLGTDPAVKDLPRVMRLPGTLHLKDPAEPRLVKLLNSPNASVKRWPLSDFLSKLGLSPAAPAPRSNVMPSKPPEGASDTSAPAAFDVLPLGQDRETNIDEIHSAMMAIPPSAISTEPEWVKLARALAHEAGRFPKQREELEQILDEVSRDANGYNKEDNRQRFQRYINEASHRESPITIATVFHMAREHGWRGWSPPLAPTGSAPVVWSSRELQVSFSNIPHRRWLYGVDLVRGDITLIGSPGGAGKTSLALGMAVSIATGRELLEEKIFGGEGLKALYINTEDSGIEMRRRAWAFCRKHNIAEHDLERLSIAGTDDPRVQRLSFLRTLGKRSTIDQEGFRQFEELLARLKPDLVVLDPMIALCGGGDVNDNAAMSLVMRDINRLAIKYDCAVLIIAHTKKGGDLTSAEAITGAAAIVNLARHAIMTVTMTEEEAKRIGVLPSERYRYFKAIDAKSNLAPRSSDAPWYELCSEELPNADPPIYPNGDRVQAIARADLSLLNSAAPTADDLKIRRAILDLVHRGKLIDDHAYPYSPASSGAHNQRALVEDAMTAVATATLPRSWPLNDLKAITERAIANMKSDGWLVEDVIKTKRFRRSRGLRVDWTATPWPEADKDARTA